ncbi:MAG: hypothetical protein SGI77_09615 [Pirellulaceae bacterium]|nr:hypothetical protein [Pirellulaceae bacterium]
MNRFLYLALPLFGLALLQGCAHHQLRFNTAGHAKTVADVHTQQVLDNIAKFVANPNSLPHFEFPNQGGSGVTDDANGATGANFNPFGLTGWSIGAGARRTSNVSFTMTPVNDPRKLELMRCAYQRAMGACCCNGESAHCPDCKARFNNFYLGTTTPSKTVLKTPDGRPILLFAQDLNEKKEALLDQGQNPIGQRVVTNTNALDQKFYTDLETGEIVLSVEAAGIEENAVRLKKLFIDDSVSGYTDRSGTVTASCLGGTCWFKVGKKSAIPRDCLSCGYVGRYCGTNVWVPECGRDQLTKLTLTILDIALNDAPKSRTKDVVAYLDAEEALTTEENASFKITATVPVSTSVKDVVPGAKKGAIATRRLAVELSLAKEKVAEAERIENLSKNRFMQSFAEAKNDDKATKFLNDNLRQFNSQEEFKGGIEELAAEIAKVEGMAIFGLKELNTQDLVQKSVSQARAFVDARKMSAAAKEHERTLTELKQTIENESQNPEYQTSPVENLPPDRTYEPPSGVLQLDQQLRTLRQ